LQRFRRSSKITEISGKAVNVKMFMSSVEDHPLTIPTDLLVNLFFEHRLTDF